MEIKIDYRADGPILGTFRYRLATPHLVLLGLPILSAALLFFLYQPDLWQTTFFSGILETCPAHGVLLSFKMIKIFFNS